MKSAPYFVCLWSLTATLAFAVPPETKKLPVSDTYHGVTVRDDYRWLENWDDPEVKQWSAAENARSANSVTSSIG